MDKYLIQQIPDIYSAFIDANEDLYGCMKDEMVLEVFEPEEKIIDRYKPIDCLRFMVQGKAKITLLHEDGNQSIVHFAQPGEFLGELTFLEVEDEHKNVTAISPCVFLSVPMTRAMNRLKEDSHFLFQMARIEGFKMHMRAYSKSKNQNYALKNRLAAYILMSEHNGIYKEKHTETSEYLGVSYRHLLHTMKGFLNEGTIKKEKSHYIIDVERLKTYAVDIERI